MGSLTNTLEMGLLNHLFNSAWTNTATVYLALCTADPTDAALGSACNEVANQYGYQRTAISFGAAATRKITQDADCDFPQASGGGWGTVTHWCIIDVQTYGSGNALAYGAFTTGKTINDGNTPSVASGEIYVEFSAGEISNYAANGLLDFIFDNGSFSQPTIYIALVKTTTVTDSDTGSTIVEPSGGAYARQQISGWDDAVSGDPSYVDNTAAITFPQATADWGTIIAVAAVTASSAGEVLMYDNDMTDQDVNNGDTAEFAAGQLDFQMS